MRLSLKQTTGPNYFVQILASAKQRTETQKCIMGKFQNMNLMVLRKIKAVNNTVDWADCVPKADSEKES